MSTTRSGATAVVAVAGEVDCSTAPVLSAAVESLLATGPVEVVVDLCEVTFLDSAGLHALVTAHTRVGERGARLRVRVATHAVLRPIQVTGLEDVLSVERAEAGAA